MDDKDFAEFSDTFKKQTNAAADELVDASELPSEVPTLFDKHPHQLGNLCVDVTKSLRQVEALFAELKGTASMMKDRAAAALMRKLCVHVQLLLCLEHSHPGANVDKLGGTKIELAIGGEVSGDWYQDLSPVQA